MIRMQVIFRPTYAQQHEDSVTCTVDGLPFTVSLKACLPQAVLKLPPSLDFGTVPTTELALQKFTISNTGDKEVGTCPFAGLEQSISSCEACSRSYECRP